MKCPICKKDVKFDDPFMPFCSDRCKEIDLGNWATEKYTIPGPDLPTDGGPLSDEED
jgi:uncharacterized protein